MSRQQLSLDMMVVGSDVAIILYLMAQRNAKIFLPPVPSVMWHYRSWSAFGLINTYYKKTTTTTTIRVGAKRPKNDSLQLNTGHCHWPPATVQTRIIIITSCLQEAAMICFSHCYSSEKWPSCYTLSIYRIAHTFTIARQKL